jgi:hypothetical protein
VRLESSEAGVDTGVEEVAGVVEGVGVVGGSDKMEGGIWDSREECIRKTWGCVDGVVVGVGVVGVGVEAGVVDVVGGMIEEGVVTEEAVEEVVVDDDEGVGSSHPHVSCVLFAVSFEVVKLVVLLGRELELLSLLLVVLLLMLLLLVMLPLL